LVQLFCEGTKNAWPL